MSKHDEIANKLAKKIKTEYKSDKGVDLVLKDKVIGVETKWCTPRHFTRRKN